LADWRAAHMNAADGGDVDRFGAVLIEHTEATALRTYREHYTHLPHTNSQFTIILQRKISAFLKKNKKTWHNVLNHLFCGTKRDTSHTRTDTLI
jgi:hypothetical protein